MLTVQRKLASFVTIAALLLWLPYSQCWADVLDDASLAGSNMDQVTTPPPPKMEDSGRKGKSGAAKAAAIVGAVMAFASCAMLLAQAQKLKAQGKDEEAAQMMAQAMQQCGQGAQNLANAAENDEGSKKMTQPAAMPNVAFNSGVKKPEEKKNDFKFPTNGKSDDSPSIEVPAANTEWQIPDFGDITIPDGNFDTSTNAFDGDWSISAGVDGGAVALSPLSEESVTMDENHDGLDDSPLSNVSSTGGSNLTASDQKLAEALDAIQDQGNVRLPPPEEFYGGSGGSGSKSFSRSEGDFDVSSFMNGFLGKGKGGSASIGSQIIRFPGKKGKKDGKPKLNIFEYASHRYRMAVYTAGKVNTKMQLVAKQKKTTLTRAPASLSPTMAKP